VQEPKPSDANSGQPISPDCRDNSIITSRPVCVKPPVKRGGISRLEAIIELFVVLAMLFGPSAVRMLIENGDPESTAYQQMGLWVYLHVAATGVFALLLVWFILHKDGQSFRSIGLHGRALAAEFLVALGTLVTIYGALFVTMIIWMVVSRFWPQAAETTIKERLALAELFPELPVGALVVFCLFVGFYEELLFRGFVLGRLKVVFGNWPAAVLASGAIFACGHLYEGTFAIAQIFVMSLILAVVYVWRRSVVGIGLAHAAFNAISLLVMYNFDYLQQLFRDYLPNVQ